MRKPVKEKSNDERDSVKRVRGVKEENENVATRLLHKVAAFSVCHGLPRLLFLVWLVAGCCLAGLGRLRRLLLGMAAAEGCCWLGLLAGRFFRHSCWVAG